ncbi:hypothetical protein [Caudoviricetes sp.]|nr:hypothetical protein [Caudoviricetes sp.]
MGDVGNESTTTERARAGFDSHALNAGSLQGRSA